MPPALPAIDVETFARTALRFAAKRRALNGDAARALNGDIVQRLTALVPDTPANDRAAIASDSLMAFCDALVQPQPDASLKFAAELRAEGMTRHDIYLHYFAAAARALGDGWDVNRFSLTEVTIATGHLYALMRALRIEGEAARPAFDMRKCALFAAVPGESHSIGLTIAADLFRDAGWEIDLQIATDHTDLVKRAERNQPGVVGLSLSTRARLPALARLVVALRLALPHAILGVAPAADLDAAEIDTLLDVDLVLRDADTARADLERLIAPKR